MYIIVSLIMPGIDAFIALKVLQNICCYCWTRLLQMPSDWASDLENLILTSARLRENVFRMALVEGQRNFRSHYYEKVKNAISKKIPFQIQVGFRGVEEKKSLDLLLGEKPVDLARIQNFCLRFPLPSIYRTQVIHK